jgi:hypothetical protein
LRKRWASRYRRLLGLQKRQGQKKTSPCHITVKTLGIKNKERILKSAREEHQVTSLMGFIRIKANLSTETLKARRAWNDDVF